MNFNHSYIGPDELIYNNDGEIHSGGFSVNSIMLKNGLSPIMTLNNNNANVNTYSNQMGGEKVSDLFNNLVIPNWSLSYNYKNGAVYQGGANGVMYNSNKKRGDDEYGEHDDEVMEESLHDKLLNLVKVDKTEMKISCVSNKKSSKKNFKSTMKTKKNVTKKVKKI
jgi:hypothetical protein